MKTKYWLLLLGAILAVCLGLSFFLLNPGEAATHADIISSGTIVRTVDLRVDQESLARSYEWVKKYGGKLGPNDPMVYGRDWYYNGGTIYGIRPYNIYDYMIAEWAPTQTHNATVSGRKGSTTFNVGLSYLDESGMMKTAKDDSHQKYNASVKLETEINKWLTVRALQEGKEHCLQGIF